MLRTKLAKKWSRWYVPRSNAIRDLLIFFGITIGAFLPARMIFYEYVTHHIFPNMGVVTVIAVVMFLLIRSDKLGFVGRAFKRQMQRFTARRTFRKVLIISIVLNVYLGATLYLMERGEFHYEEERLNIGAIYIYQLVIEERSNYQEVIRNIIDAGEYPEPERMISIGTWGQDEMLEYASYYLHNDDFAMSVSAYESNMLYGGWPSHFNTVFFVEELEAVGLWFLYRRWYYKKTDALPWCGFNKHLKKVMYRKVDHIDNIRVPNKLLFRFFMISVVVGITTYIVIGLSGVQILALIFITFVLQFALLPNITSIRIYGRQKKQFAKFRMVMFAIIAFVIIYLITKV